MDRRIIAATSFVSGRAPIEGPADPYRCDFCDVSLGSDFDLTKHLDESKHRERLENSRSAIREENLKSARSGAPSVPSFKELLLLMNTRCEIDVLRLYDKGFLKINNEKQSQLAHHLVHALILSVAKYKFRKCPESAREVLLDCLVSTLDEPSVDEVDVQEHEAVIQKEPSPAITNSSQRERPPPVSQVATSPVVPPPLPSLPHYHPSHQYCLIGEEEDMYLPPEYRGNSNPIVGVNSIPAAQLAPPSVEQPKKKLSNASKIKRVRAGPEVRKEPEPDPKSTYVPQLAVIKIERKD